MEENYYERERNKAYKMYRKINFIECPIFNNEPIYFDDRGFRHFVYKRKDKRPLEDQLRRFRLLPHARSIISEARNYKIREENLTKFYSLSKRFFKYEIIVIIRQIGNNRKHFFSIMTRKAKTLS